MSSPPALSELDLGLVEKIYQCVQAQERYYAALFGRASAQTGSAWRTSSIPLARHEQSQPPRRQDAVSLANTQSARPQPSPQLPPHRRHDKKYSDTERELWTQLSTVFYDAAMAERLHICAYITTDAQELFSLIARRLLDYLQRVFDSWEKGHPRLTALARHSEDRTLFMLMHFCSRDACVRMMRGDVVSGASLYESTCTHVAQHHHLTWMSQIYVDYCDHVESREANMISCTTNFIATTSTQPTHVVRTPDESSHAHLHASIVEATLQALQCIRGCCAGHVECAHELLFVEPVACVSHLLYGLRMRVSHELRQYPSTTQTGIVASAAPRTQARPSSSSFYLDLDNTRTVGEGRETCVMRALYDTPHFVNRPRWPDAASSDSCACPAESMYDRCIIHTDGEGVMYCQPMHITRRGNEDVVHVITHSAGSRPACPDEGIDTAHDAAAKSNTLTRLARHGARCCDRGRPCGDGR